MLPVQFIRDHQDRIAISLEKRQFNDNPHLVEEILQADTHRKQLEQQLQEHNAASNRIAKEIPQLFKSGNREEAEQKKEAARALKATTASVKTELDATKAQLQDLLLQMPNCANDLVPKGASEEDNIVHQAWDTALPELNTEAQPHWELAKTYGLIDFELGAKITGAGFPVYTGKGAQLQRALISFFLDEARKAGYKEYQVPFLVNEDSARGTGQLPDKEGQMYHATKDDLYLIPTAEVPLTNLYRNTLLQESDLPIKVTGYTPCFRREAGSYGAHVRGLNRLHQFDKVEIVQIEHPERSYDTLMDMCQHVEGVLKKLELPYRILLLCGGDLGFASAITYDFETYSAAQKRWLEVSSVSNFEVFQTNRLKLRYKNADGINQLAHTLNGSALALPRIVATLLENNQTPEGIHIPTALQPYTGFEWIKKD